MRKIVLIPMLAAVLLVSGSSAGLAASQTPLTSIRQVTALTNGQAARSIPVKLKGTITYVQPQDDNLFVQDEGAGVYVNFSKDIGLLPGDRVEISGVTSASFRPELIADQVRFVAHGKLPEPRPAKFEDLIQAKLDSLYVTISGHILSATLDAETPYHGLRFKLRVPQGVIGGVIARPGQLKPEDLLGADVRLTGVAGGAFDSKMQMAGVWMDLYAPDGLQIEHRPPVDPWSEPLVPMDQVIYAYRSANESQRVRISGTLTYYEPGTVAVIEDKGQSMLVNTGTTSTLHAGTAVEAMGFPEVTNDTVWLDHGALRSLQQSGTVQPQNVKWGDASAGKFAYNLVSMEGQIVVEVHDSRVDLFILLAPDGHLFSATVRHVSSDAAQPADTGVMPVTGSRVRVTGVCFTDPGNHWRDRLWFDIRMRSLSDIAVLQPPSWWTVKRLSYVITLLSAVILIAVIWAGLLDRRLREQTEVLARQSQEDAIRERRRARQEQQRSRILELISSPEPLHEVLKEIQAIVSSRLFGARCWIDLNNPAVGDSHSEPDLEPGVVTRELLSPDGTSLGFLRAIPQPRASSPADVEEAMTAGACLAELAIDTRRLYSDLRRRSEFDLLTDVPNRFSMERKLDQMMLTASNHKEAFGLVYVDLDCFKDVNDQYGHRIGDLYLKEVTRRMKMQLRAGDFLARIGGDEFIALTPILHGRTDAEEIASRLENCFEEPFLLEGHQIFGGASVGLAVYPEDGTTSEELQRAADAAMYAHKESKRQNGRGPSRMAV